jgi:hypothetical protein
MHKRWKPLTRPAVALLAVSTLSTLPVRAEIVDLKWSPEGRVEHSSNVAPGRFVELCGKLAAGDQVRWSFTSSAPSDFNIHYHLSKSEVVYPARTKAVQQAQDTLAVTLAQDYCWMWSNKGSAALQLKARLERVAR